MPQAFGPTLSRRLIVRLAPSGASTECVWPSPSRAAAVAWGFPSPDSDYDCRFIFVRPIDQLVTLWPPRDVIDLPIEAELDVSGWELGKALRLLLKGNAVVIEWLMSPILYAGDEEFRDEMLEFAGRYADPVQLQHHYLHLGERQRATYLAGVDPVPLKKLFYVLRPAAALRWMRLNPERKVPPMHFPTLVHESDWPPDAAALVDDLLAAKAVTREMGEGPVPSPLHALIEAEFDAAAARLAGALKRPRTEAAEAANALFKVISRRMDGRD